MRRHLDGQLAHRACLVSGEQLEVTPGAGQNTAVEPSLLAHLFARFFQRSLGAARHSFYFERFEHEQDVVRIDQSSAGLMRKVLAQPPRAAAGGLAADARLYG